MHGNKGDYRLGANLKCLRYKKKSSVLFTYSYFRL